MMHPYQRPIGSAGAALPAVLPSDGPQSEDHFSRAKERLDRTRLREQLLPLFVVQRSKMLGKSESHALIPGGSRAIHTLSD